MINSKQNKIIKKYLVLAYGVFHEFAKSSQVFKNGTEARQVYDKYLFHFMELRRLENLMLNTSDADNIHKKMIDCLTWDPSYLLDVPIIECKTDDKEEIQNMILEGLKYDLVILRGFLDKFGFNPKYFTEKFIVETYKDQKIEIIEQQSRFLGFTTNL